MRNIIWLYGTLPRRSKYDNLWIKCLLSYMLLTFKFECKSIYIEFNSSTKVRFYLWDFWSCWTNRIIWIVANEVIWIMNALFILVLLRWKKNVNFRGFLKKFRSHYGFPSVLASAWFWLDIFSIRRSCCFVLLTFRSYNLMQSTSFLSISIL